MDQPPFAPTKRQRQLDSREEDGIEKGSDNEDGNDEEEEEEDDDDDEGNEFGVDDGCMFDVEAFDIDEPWCVFNVMLIATNEGVSRRVGLGKVHVAAFTEDHGARWRDIVLA
jgi:hypothetical protein